jgi:hypothetical protein
MNQMNDFLQSLRNNQAEKPRTPKTRKNYDNSYHYTSAPRFQSYGGFSNSRNPQMKRPSATHHQGNQAPVMDDSTVTSMLAEAIESLSRHIETLANNQDYLVTVQERTADMLERQAIAIEKIVSYLDLSPGLPIKKQKTDQFDNHYVTPAVPEEAAPEAKTQKAKPAKSKKPAKSVIRRRKIVSETPKKRPAGNAKLMSREAIMEIIHTMRGEGATYDQVASHLIDLGQPTFSGRGEWHAQTIHRLCSK